MPHRLLLRNRGQSGWGYVLARVGTSTAHPGCTEVQSDGREPGCGSAWGRGEWLQGLERAEPRPRLRGSSTPLWAPISSCTGRQKPPANHRPQHRRIKYTDIFIVSKGPQSGEEASGNLGPPRQPRAEAGLNTPSPPLGPVETYPRAPPAPGPRMSVL